MNADKAWPVPYCGPLDERTERLGAPHVRTTCGQDSGGTTTYRYNSLGYRGDEFRSDARLKIHVFGESDAFGMGVQHDDAWPCQVAAMLREELGLAPHEVGLMNFAEPGGSSELVARQVITQCSAVRPDLVLLNFSEPERTEGFVGGRVFSVGLWLQDPAFRKRIEDMSDSDKLKQPFVEALERGCSYLDFSSQEHGGLATVRSVLLSQYFLASCGVAALATIRSQWHPCGKGLEDNAAIAPLLARIDDEFLAAHPYELPKVDLSADGGHHGPRGQGDIAKFVMAKLQANGTVQKLRQQLQADAECAAPAQGDAGESGGVAHSVRSFYEELPFGFHGRAEDAATSVREHSLASIYPDLHAVLSSQDTDTVTEFGCGSGWLACTMAYHYGLHVTAVDFTSAALSRAREVAALLGVSDRVRFVESDLFEYQPDALTDVVVSLGVLHHTRDARAAFEHIQTCATPGGTVYVGLYHEPGRAPFLELFRNLLDSEGEDAALQRYAELDGIHANEPTILRSWFRDQVIHPHETQHTLREVCGWFADAGLALASTSINKFGVVGDVEQLFTLEQTFGERSRQANIEERRYFPGFFTAMARRASDQAATG